MSGENANHDESHSGQEEVYVPLQGSAHIDIDGTEHILEPGVLVRVAAGTPRKITPGADGMRMLVIGNVLGAEPPVPAAAH